MGAPFSAADGKLLARRLEEIKPYYCRMCGHCEGQCSPGPAGGGRAALPHVRRGLRPVRPGARALQSPAGGACRVRCGSCADCTVDCPSECRWPPACIKPSRFSPEAWRTIEQGLTHPDQLLPDSLCSICPRCQDGPSSPTTAMSAGRPSRSMCSLSDANSCRSYLPGFVLQAAGCACNSPTYSTMPAVRSKTVCNRSAIPSIPGMYRADRSLHTQQGASATVDDVPHAERDANRRVASSVTNTHVSAASTAPPVVLVLGKRPRMTRSASNGASVRVEEPSCVRRRLTRSRPAVAIMSWRPRSVVGSWRRMPWSTGAERRVVATKCKE